jgi:hypothetical protein
MPAILLLSDGVHNAGGAAGRVVRSAEKARAMAVPIYTKTIGGQTGVNDVNVSLGLTQEMAFVDQEVVVAVAIEQHGGLMDRTRLTLIEADKVVDEQDVPLVADGASEATFRVRQSRSGFCRYEVRADEHPDEVTGVNNRATLLLRVIDEPVRMMLLEGKPYWDTKFLLRTLAADPSIDLTSVVRMAEGRFLQREISHLRQQADGPAEDSPDPPTESGETPMPTNEATEEAPSRTEIRRQRWEVFNDLDALFDDPAMLASRQIVVLGRDAEVFLSDSVLSQLKKWLADGDGSLVCFRGSPTAQVGQRLGEQMPVRWEPASESRFRMRLTDLGHSMRWLTPTAGDADLLTSMPSLATVNRPEGRKPLATVLATTSGDAQQSDPVITYQPFGNGRVVVVEGAGMWRWAFLPPGHERHDEVYGRLWRSLFRWLAAGPGLLPSDQLALRSDQVTFSTSDVATATLVLRDTEAGGDPPQVDLTGPSLEPPMGLAPMPAGTSPGQFRVSFGKLAEGRYEARVVGADANDSSAVTAFDVRGNLDERLDVAARPDLMRQIAETSGGAVLAADDADELASRFYRYRAGAQPAQTTRHPAWDRWWVLLAVFGLWATTWGLRRRSGLI